MSHYLQKIYYRETFKRLKDQWRLKGDGALTYRHSSAIAYVLYDGCPAVLKIFDVHSDERLSSKVLPLLSGTVRILQQDQHAVLLERIIPGLSLKKLFLQEEDGKAVEIFCTVVQNLQKYDAVPNNFPTIAEWKKSFNTYLQSEHGYISRPLIHKAKNLFNTLVAAQGKQLLLHGDLHHNNILFDQKCGWLAIDPKGVIGEAEIEVAAFLKNPVGHPEIYAHESIISKRINRITDALNLDSNKIVKWCFCLTVLSCIWLIEEDKNPDDWLHFAEIMDGLM